MALDLPCGAGATESLPTGFISPSHFPRLPATATWIPRGKGKEAKLLSFVSAARPAPALQL